MPTLSQRSLVGFVAGAIAVLLFHQGAVGVLHALGLTPLAPYRTVPTPPFWLPLVVNLAFWGGIYGALFGAALPRLRLPAWAGGLLLGLVAALIGWFVLAPLRHQPFAAGFAPWPMTRSLLVNLAWGLGTGLLVPLLSPRPLWRRAHG